MLRTLARRGDRSEILARLQRLRPDSPRGWGAMSPHQAVCHLADAFRMLLGEKAVRQTPTLAQRTVVKWIALYVPLAWPAGVRTVPEADQLREGTRPVEFAADFARLQELLQRVIDAGPRLDGRRHPIFGRLSAAAWLRWGYLHLDHHLRQFGA